MNQNHCQGRVTRKASFGQEILGAAAGLLLALLLIPVGALAEDEPALLEVKPEQAEAPSAPVVDPELVESVAPGEASRKPEYTGIEEILVTAQKRSSKLQETPSAITALSGAQLFDRGIYDVESLATQIPNFQYGETFGVARLTIRGIGNEGLTDPSTAFHIDGVYQNNQTAAGALTFYDIAQVEVLRGPQGTLWGRNSTAGAINVSTRAPVHELEIFGDLLRGSYEEWFGRGVVNVPILEDRIAARTAFFFNKRDGYQENLAYPGTASQNADDSDNWGIRPQLLFEITDEISLTMRGGYDHQGGVGWGSKTQGAYPGTYLFTPNPIPIPASPPFIPEALDLYMFVDPYHSQIDGTPMQPNPADPRQIRRNARQFQDIDTWHLNGTLLWDFFVPGIGDLSFSIVGSYRDEVRSQNFDFDFSDQDMLLGNITASTRDRVIDAHLRSAGDSSTQWLLGFFMLDADGQLNINVPGPGGSTNLFVGEGGRVCTVPAGETAPPPDCTPWALEPFPGVQIAPVILGDEIDLSGARGGLSNEILSLAGYGHLRREFFEDKLSIGLGLRYSWDRVKGTRSSDMVTVSGPRRFQSGRYVDIFPAGDADGDGIPDNCIQPGTATDDEATWGGVTGDLKIDFKPAADHMVYASISHGYKPGYINGNAQGRGCVPPNITPLDNAADETIWAYEIGSKNRFLDNTVQANLTGFVYQYENLQVVSRSDNSSFIQNAPKAQVWGIEFEGIWEPIEDLSLNVVYGYLNAHYLDYIGYNFATGQIENFSGHRMVRAPEHTATLAAEYLWSLEGKGRIIPRIQYFVSDSIYFNAANSLDSLEPSYGTLQIRTRWESEDDRLFIEGFIENVTDEDVRSTRSVGSALLGRPITVAYEPPRTWGVRIGGSY
jgi:iron complex outermembrane receptor protein